MTGRSYRISLLNKVKKVPLPPLSTWSGMIERMSVSAAWLDVKVIDRKSLFGRKIKGEYYCVIGKKGYIVVYKDIGSYPCGYAFNLATAKKIVVSKRTEEETQVSIVWGYGKLKFTLRNWEEVEINQLGLLFDAFRITRADGDINEYQAPKYDIAKGFDGEGIATAVQRQDEEHYEEVKKDEWQDIMSADVSTVYSKRPIVYQFFVDPDAFSRPFANDFAPMGLFRQLCEVQRTDPSLYYYIDSLLNKQQLAICNNASILSVAEDEDGDSSEDD